MDRYYIVRIVLPLQSRLLYSRVSGVNCEDGVTAPHVLPHASHRSFAPPCRVLSAAGGREKGNAGRRYTGRGGGQPNNRRRKTQDAGQDGPIARV